MAKKKEEPYRSPTGCESSTVLYGTPNKDTLTRRRIGTVQCKWPAGHLADGSHGLAFHSARHGTQIVVWEDGQSRVDKGDA